MAKVIIFTKGAADGAAIKTGLTNNSIPFTEVRVDLLQNADLPDVAGVPREFGITELKAMIYETWVRVRAL